MHDGDLLTLDQLGQVSSGVAAGSRRAARWASATLFAAIL